MLTFTRQFTCLRAGSGGGRGRNLSLPKLSAMRTVKTGALIPQNPAPKEKSRTVVADPSAVQELASVPACGPRGILLFGLTAEESQTVVQWLAAVEKELPVVSFSGSSGRSDLTVEEALSYIQSEPPSTAPACSDVSQPVVLFSGLIGEEIMGLLEAWEPFTEMPCPASASVSASILQRNLQGLLMDVIRANASPSPSSKSEFTVMGKSGSVQVAKPEDLKSTVQEAVAKQRQRRRKEKAEAPVDEADAVLGSLRAGKRRGESDTKPSKGFQ